MSVARPKKRPSSLDLQKLLNIQLNKNQFPTQIWPSNPQPSPPPPLPPPPSPLKLSHPLLRLLDSLTPSSTPHFDQLLAQLITSGLADHPLAAGRAVKHLCSSSSLPRAVALFASLSHPDAFIANTILRSLLAASGPVDALAFYRRCVLPAAVRPNHYTFPLLAKLSADLGLSLLGHAVHALASKSGLHSDLFVCNSLIHMYSSFSDIAAARRIFESFLLDSDVVTWNSMLAGFVKNGLSDDARRLFDEMPERDMVSWNTMIAGHAGAGEMESARELFEEMPVRDEVSWNSMIDGYAKAGEVVASRGLFDVMPRRHLVSWNIILALHARVKDYRECLKLFDGMMAVGDVKPNEATLVSVLTACANLGELERGKWVHSLMENGCGGARVEPDVLLSTALLTMYAKCGAMETAREIFDRMSERSVVSWNSMIVGYGLHGHGQKAMELFLEMEKWGPKPNESTFVCILSACAHGGMVLEGWWCFSQMIQSYGIEPKVEHFGCMVDLLGRAGLLKDSVEMIKAMPAQEGPTPTLWGALLSACRTHSEAELGEIVGRKLIEMKPGEIGPYVLLSNMYAARGRWDEVERVREMMRENGLQKSAGFSLVSLDSTVSDPLEKDSNLVTKKRMVYSMLREMGAHLKLSCRESGGQENYDVEYLLR